MCCLKCRYVCLPVSCSTLCRIPNVYQGKSRSFPASGGASSRPPSLTARPLLPMLAPIFLYTAFIDELLGVSLHRLRRLQQLRYRPCQAIHNTSDFRPMKIAPKPSQQSARHIILSACPSCKRVSRVKPWSTSTPRFFCKPWCSRLLRVERPGAGGSKTTGRIESETVAPVRLYARPLPNRPARCYSIAPSYSRIHIAKTRRSVQAVGFHSLVKMSPDHRPSSYTFVTADRVFPIPQEGS